MPRKSSSGARRVPPPRGRRGTRPAHADRLQLQAPKDGEYFFTMVTVDRQGKCVPADIAKEEPAIGRGGRYAGAAADPVLVAACRKARDPVRRSGHASGPARTRMQYQTADKLFATWTGPGSTEHLVHSCPGETLPGSSGSSPRSGGNVTTRECTLGQLPTLLKSTPAKSAQAALRSRADRAAERAIDLPGRETRTIVACRRAQDQRRALRKPSGRPSCRTI